MTQIPAVATGVLAVVNAAAGSARDDAVAAAMVVLRARADVELVPTTDTAELGAVLEVQGGRRLVVLGGDGTLHAVAGELARAGRLRDAGPVGLVPLGTGNDLARSLGIPLDPAAAAAVAAGGSWRAVEMLRDDRGGVVVNAVHAGIGAEAAARAGDRKPRLGAAAYAVAAVEAGVLERGWRLRVTVDGTVLHDGDRPVLMVAVGLGSSIGGGARVSPSATPFDGVADVMVSGSVGPLARLGYAVQMVRGAHVERDDVVTARGREVLVEAVDDANAFRTNADGEVRGPFTRTSWQIVRDAWRLVVPTPASRPRRR